MNTAHCTLHTTQWTLHTAHYTMNTAYCTVCTTQWTLHTKQWTLHTAHYTMNTSHCTLHTAHCTLHTEHSTLHTPHWTLLTVLWTLYTSQWRTNINRPKSFRSISALTTKLIGAFNESLDCLMKDVIMPVFVEQFLVLPSLLVRTHFPTFLMLVYFFFCKSVVLLSSVTQWRDPE